MVKICPICAAETHLIAETREEVEFGCDQCGARFARMKGDPDYDVVFPGVPCPACFSHDIEGYANPSERQPMLEDFVFRCPRTRQFKSVSYDAEGGLEVALAVK